MYFLQVLGPGVIERDLRTIANLEDFKKRKNKLPMLDLDVACLTIDSVVKRLLLNLFSFKVYKVIKNLVSSD